MLNFGHYIIRISALAVGLCLLTGCATTTCAQKPQVQQFIADVAARDHFDQAQLTKLFNHVTPDHKIIAAISSPHEKSAPWYAYRGIFITPQRAEEGALFWRQHASALKAAAKRYGVPPQIIVAILGVETRYGTHEGGDSALTALSTLAFYYPPRAPYFRNELEQYLLLTRQNNLDPLALKSSYAGALGAPQFMPSSYRTYAVDYAGKGHSDLFNNANDIIFSVANYFQAHGWRTGQPVAIRARVYGQDYRYLPHSLEPKLTIAQLTHYGVHGLQPLPAREKAAFIELQARYGKEYWLGLHNFYVITRYNPSALYAMAVYQLSELIRDDYQKI